MNSSQIKSRSEHKDMRNTLGFTGQKDPMKRDDSAINIKIILHGAAARNLEVIISGQGYREFLYERGSKGTIMSMYEYKVTSEEAKRKRFGADRDIGTDSTSKEIAKYGISRSDLRTF